MREAPSTGSPREPSRWSPSWAAARRSLRPISAHRRRRARQSSTTPQSSSASSRARSATALEQALANRVDAAVEAGEPHGGAGRQKLEARIASGEYPLLGVGRGFGHGPGGRVDLETCSVVPRRRREPEALRTSLQSGKPSLPPSARRRRASRWPGLVTALVQAEAVRSFDQAVAGPGPGWRRHSGTRSPPVWKPASRSG